MNKPGPPKKDTNWSLICLQAALGHSLDSLAARFDVTVSQIQHRLDLYVQPISNHTFRIRSSSEIAHASNRARNDLVTFLQDAITELIASDQPRLAQLQDFQSLLASAAKLFAWPTVSVSKVSRHDQSPSGYTDIAIEHSEPTNGAAVNLALIATSPTQLAKLAADSRKRLLSNSPASDQDAVPSPIPPSL